MSIRLMNSMEDITNVADAVQAGFEVIGFSDTHFTNDSNGRYGQKSLRLYQHSSKYLKWNFLPTIPAGNADISTINISMMIKLDNSFNGTKQTVFVLSRYDNRSIASLTVSKSGWGLFWPGSNKKFKLTKNVWHRIEIQHQSSNTGHFILKIDGNVIYDIPSTDLAYYTGAIHSFLLYGQTGRYINDLLITQNDGVDMIAPPTDFTIEKLHANGTVTTDWSISGAATADEALLTNDSDTSYITTAVAADVARIEMSDITRATPDVVFAIQTNILAKTIGTLSLQITPSLEVGANTNNGSSYIPALDYDAYKTNIFETINSLPLTPLDVTNHRIKLESS